MSRSIHMRAATPGDAEAIWSLLQPVFRAGETYAIERDISREAAVAYWTSPPSRAFVAEDGDVLGTYYLRPNQRGGGAHVANAGFVSAAAARGRGLARTMLHHAEDEARRAGFRAMQFNFVLASNVGALHVWTTEGYSVVGQLPNAFEHPTLGLVDALVLFKTLTEAP